MDVVEHIDALKSYVERQDFAGHDPYDALNSPIVRSLSFGQKYARIAWTQLLRRCPINLRHILRVPLGHNPKGVGLFIAGYARLFALHQHRRDIAQIQKLVRILEKAKSVGYSGNSWGYDFDWQSRAFYLRKHTPTVVNSAFIGHALLDAYEYLGEQSYLEMAHPISDFILNDLYRTKCGDTFCFSYTPVDKTAIHNANLLGASLLIRLYKYSGKDALRDAALSSLAYSMNNQRRDGSWYYAETEFQKWIDSFHTGFNLEAIRWFRRCGEASEYEASYAKGVEFYSSKFFHSNGLPKYFHDKTYPIDIHAPAEAIAFFSAEGVEYSDLTDSVLAWMLSNLRDPRGYFYFRKGRLGCNRIPYMRWGQAWAFRCLTEYAIQRQQPLSLGD